MIFEFIKEKMVYRADLLYNEYYSYRFLKNGWKEKKLSRKRIDDIFRGSLLFPEMKKLRAMQRKPLKEIFNDAPISLIMEKLLKE